MSRYRKLPNGRFRRLTEAEVRRRDRLKVLAVVAVAAVVVLLVGSVVLALSGVSEHSACTVVDKDRATSANGTSEMRVYTANCGTFVMEDDLFSGRFDTADAYARIERGHTYDLTVRGPRVPMMSIFPNIIDARERR